MDVMHPPTSSIFTKKLRHFINYTWHYLLDNVCRKKIKRRRAKGYKTCYKIMRVYIKAKIALETVEIPCVHKVETVIKAGALRYGELTEAIVPLSLYSSTTASSQSITFLTNEQEMPYSLFSVMEDLSRTSICSLKISCCAQTTSYP